MNYNNGLKYKPARMIDVAQLAGVSVQTVSRVVNDQPNVKESVRERVQNAIGTLNYRPNQAARSLVTSRSMSIGVVTHGLEQFGPTVVLTGLVSSLRRQGYTANVLSLEALDPTAVQRAFNDLVEEHVDGIVVLAPLDAAVQGVLSATSPVPVVRLEQGGTPGSDRFVTDDVLGARLATEHLLGLGHETIAHLRGPTGWLASNARVEGWRSALEERRLPMPPPIATDWTAKSGYEAGRAFLSSGATAAFVANDQIALGLIAYLSEAGISVPGEVSLVGFDDIPEAHYFMPSLTTIRIDYKELGRSGAETMLAKVRGESAPPRFTHQPEFVERASTAKRA